MASMAYPYTVQDLLYGIGSTVMFLVLIMAEFGRSFLSAKDLNPQWI